MSEAPAAMAAFSEIIEASTVPGYQGIYFLGPFAKRVSFASQQHRALNLIWALKESSQLATGDHVAVIGGGLAGLTAAAALIAVNCLVTLFEVEDLVLQKQRDTTHRFVHPSINLWPFDVLNPTTAFPFLDWYSDRCSDVISRLEAEWHQKIASQLTKINVSTRVNAFKRKAPPIVLSLQRAGSGADQKYDSVKFDGAVVTTGFGEELEIRKFDAKSYWAADDTHTGAGPRQFWVSGTGDGGLIDALRLTHKHFRGGEFVVHTAERVASGIAARIKSLEIAARSTKPRNAFGALQKGYNEIFGMLPKSLLDYLDDSLIEARDDPVLLIGRARTPFSVDSAPIHKLLLVHAIRNKRLKYFQGELGGTATAAFVAARSGRRLRKTGQTVIPRHGATNTLTRFLGPDEVKVLGNKQSILMDRLALQLWPAKYFHLPGYPPHDPTDISFIRSKYNCARAVALRYEGVTDLQIRGRAFEFVVSDHTKLLSQMPQNLFGVPVTSVQQAFGRRVSGMRPSTRHRSLLQSGSKVRSARASNYGTVGSLLINSAGELYGLIASHVIHPGDPVIVNSAGDVIGSCDQPITGQSGSNIQETLCLFQIGLDTEVTAQCGIFPEIRPVITQWEALDREVVRPDDATKSGTVTAICVSVCFEDPFGPPVTYRGAVEVSSNGEVPFAGPGDSGALVTDRSGRALGIVVGVGDDRTFLAPLHSCQQLVEHRFLSRSDELKLAAKFFVSESSLEPRMNLGEMPLAA